MCLAAETNFEVENFQLLTMIFSGNFLSVEIFLDRKWASPKCLEMPFQDLKFQNFHKETPSDPLPQANGTFDQGCRKLLRARGAIS
jgi:hypothetical protein